MFSVVLVSVDHRALVVAVGGVRVTVSLTGLVTVMIDVVTLTLRRVVDGSLVRVVVIVAVLPPTDGDGDLSRGGGGDGHNGRQNEYGVTKHESLLIICRVSSR